MFLPLATLHLILGTNYIPQVQPVTQAGAGRQNPLVAQATQSSQLPKEKFGESCAKA